jgi:hypothetical protein
MRSSKDRTIEKKRRNKAMKVQKTERSRRKRLANKAKRKEIHAIDPTVKMKLIDGEIYINEDIIEVIDGEIVVKEQEPLAVLPSPMDYDDAVEEYKVAIEEPVVEKIKLKNKSALQRLTDRFKKK